MAQNLPDVRSLSQLQRRELMKQLLEIEGEGFPDLLVPVYDEFTAAGIFARRALEKCNNDPKAWPDSLFGVIKEAGGL